jgi:hypothetical protein
VNYFPGLASNRDPPDLCLLSSLDYRRELLCLDAKNNLKPGAVAYNSSYSRGSIDQEDPSSKPASGKKLTRSYLLTFCGQPL